MHNLLVHDLLVHWLTSIRRAPATTFLCDASIGKGSWCALATQEVLVSSALRSDALAESTPPMRQEARRARVSRTVVKERQVGAASRREAAAHSGAHAINREKDFGSLLTRAEKAMRVAAYLDQLKNRARVRARRDGRLNRSHNHRQPAPATDQVASMAPSMDMILEECNGSSSSSSDAEAEAADAEHQQRKRRKTALTPRQECGVDLAVRLHQDSLQQLKNSRRPSFDLHRSHASSQVAREKLAFQT